MDSYKIIIVDDNRDFLQIAATMLKGHNITTCKNYNAAINKFNAKIIFNGPTRYCL